MLKKGAKDPDKKNRDEPDIHEKPGVPFGLKKENVCPEYDLFGCACPEQADSTTLSKADCSLLTGIRDAEYQAMKDMMYATKEFKPAVAEANKPMLKNKAIDKGDSVSRKKKGKKEQGEKEGEKETQQVSLGKSSLASQLNPENTTSQGNHLLMDQEKQ